MRAFIKYSFLVGVVVLCFVSCKKESGAPKKQNTNQQTTSSLVVDDTAITNLTHNSFNNNGKFGIIIYGSSGNPEVQITFYDSQTPASGTYQITSGNISFGSCSFSYSNLNGTSTASGGLVTITWQGGTNNVASFTNIYAGGGAGNHHITGTVTY